MQDILFEYYRLEPTTWVYLSSLMTLALFFKFRRFWSVRNLDLVALIAFAPGLLLVAYEKDQLAYIWLFSIGGFFLVRLLLDPLMVRRPLLEPNLSADGLTFTGVALLVFLMTNVITAKPSEGDLEGARHPGLIMAQREAPRGQGGPAQHSPGYPLFYALANLANEALVPNDQMQSEQSRQALIQAASVRTTAILGHLAVVIGMVLIGYRHFDNIHTGVAAASLYLLLPYTAQMTGHVDHVLPAAFLVWAVASYRRPILAGIFIGLAGAIWYPLFLLPLWCSFYWRRGLLRFVIGVLPTLTVMVGSLALVSSSASAFLDKLAKMFGGTILSTEGVAGFWQYHPTAFRIPVLAAFVVLCGGLALWPAQKNLGTLLSCSAAVMLGTQFWHAHYGGIYIAWYLPLLVLTVFRPNLEDRVAQTAVADIWLPWRGGRAAAAA